MIKRIIACLTICLIITGIISPVFSDASALPQPNWNDPGISEIINISDLTGWMLNGGTYDVSTYTDAESFMNDYYAGRTSTKLVDGVDLYYNEFGIGQDLYDIGAKNFSNRLDTNRMMSSSFREHSGYGRRFSERANDSLLNTGNLYDMKIPLLNEVEFANFVGYNHDALRLYGEFFIDDSEPIQPDPDPNYLTYIDNINGNGFWWKNYSNSNGSGQGLLIYPPNLSTWTTNGNMSNSQSWIFVQSSTIKDLYINFDSTSGNWSCSCYIPRSEIYYNFLEGSSSYQVGTPWDNKFLYSGNSYDFNFSVSGTLDYVFNQIQNKFKNVNIYVNNDPWALVSEPVSPPTVTPEFPDAVGGEELPNTTWPIFKPHAPYYISVPGMLQAIDDAIQGDGKLDIDDLKPYLTDINGDPVPDPIFDPEPIPIPVPDPVNPDVVPQLPELPVMPLDMPGFNGVSVLAEIINFTNQSLPNALIVTFWGIVFGIVILGLIKILHK